jgi:hypothetical protein
VIPYAIEIAIAMNIVLIGAVLAIYFLILKKEGSTARATCPECGYDLVSANNEKARRSIFPSKQLKLIGKRVVKKIALRRKQESKIKDSTSKPIETKALIINNANEPDAPEAKLLPKTESKENKSPSETNIILVLEQESDEIKKEGPTGCIHYFGYLASLPKGTITPDECYSCSKLLECLAHAQLPESKLPLKPVC